MKPEKFAMELAKGRVVTPCVSQSSICPMLDITNGCTVEGGFVRNNDRAVECPEEKGTIIIHSEKLQELVVSQPILLINSL